MYLEKINGPQDLKTLNIKELTVLAEEIREALFNRLTKRQGHFGPNFGMVEAEIALHYVFDSPKDKFVFDVSHQTYPHKMLTGRKNSYLYDEYFDDISGYTNPKESEHDFFTVGHTSTSISLATGLAKGRDLKGDRENIVAVIGDGSLSGGEALEGLDFAGSELNSNLIIVVNDNSQSIAENHGGIYKNLELLRNTNGKAENNLFKAMGLDYIYEAEGNNIGKIVELFQKVKDIDHPIVVHIKTVKGKGYQTAEENKEAWHWSVPFDRKTGKAITEFPAEETYEEITSNFLLEKMKKDKTVVAVTPALPGSIGFNKEKRKLAGKQFVDVGIAEEQAVALVSGIAKNGGKPVLGTNSTFIQRTYDQLSQDLCIDSNPATILLNFTSFDGLTDVTHLGIFTISAFSHIPNLVFLAPTNKKEYLAMLDWSIEQKEHPVMILMPGNGVINDGRDTDETYDNLNTFKVEQEGEKIAILALGDFYQRGEDLAKEIEKKWKLVPTLINPRYVSGLDKHLLNKIRDKHQLVITLEDGILEGGFGSSVAVFYGTDHSMKVKSYGLDKKFYDRYDPKELLKDLGMTTEQIINDIQNIMNL